MLVIRQKAQREINSWCQPFPKLKADPKEVTIKVDNVIVATFQLSGLTPVAIGKAKYWVTSGQGEYSVVSYNSDTGIISAMGTRSTDVPALDTLTGPATIDVDGEVTTSKPPLVLPTATLGQWYA